MDGEELKTCQREDPELKLVIKAMEKHGELRFRPPKATVSHYWRTRKKFFILNDVLCRKWKRNRNAQEITQVVAPTSMRSDVLQSAHDDPTGGHFSTARTLARIQERYYWPGIARDVETWCRECRDCATRKPPKPTNNRAPLQPIPPPNRPFQVIAVDVAGPFPTTLKGNKYILVAADYLSKWPIAVALPNQEAATVADALMDRVFSQFGVPEMLLTDQGRNFESNLFKEICRLLSIKKARTSALHPQCDGLVERFNRTLLDRLSMNVSSNQSDWDEFIPHALLAYRTSIQESTKMTPASLVLSFDPKLPLDFLAERPVEDPTPEPLSEYVKKCRSGLQTAINAARTNILAAQKQQTKSYDKSAGKVKFAVGDRVWVFNPKRTKGKSPKLSHPWHGPYTIVGNVTPVTFRLSPDNGKKEYVAHHNRLKFCYSKKCTDFQATSYPPKSKPTPKKPRQPTLERPAFDKNIGNTIHIPPDQRQFARKNPVSNNPNPPTDASASSLRGRPQRERRVPDRYGTYVSFS